MDFPVPCQRCGEPLCAPVRFCPFCAAPQEALPVPPPHAVAPPSARPDGAASTEVTPPAGQSEPVGMPPPPAPVARQPIASAGAAMPAGDAERLRMQPPPAPVARQPIVPTTPAPTPRRAARPTRARQPGRRNPNVAASIRKLAVAGFILFCAIVLWRQLAAVPHGTLTVLLSRPAAGGSVLVDGVASGAPDTAIAVSPGRHRIGLDAPGFATQQRFVRVANGGAATLTLSPQPQPATLILDSTPSGAAVTLDGRPIGRTPLQRTLPPGEHGIGVTLAEHLPETRLVSLAPGAASHLSIPLRPVPLRTLRLEAPAGQWSTPVALPAGARFTLLFRAAVRVRVGGHVVLLQPGAPVALGQADADGLSLTAVGAQPVPAQLLLVLGDTTDPD